ncbi:MAG: DUF1501 domain-containing protein [Alphaproteobacteria bacterium]|nr:DUF1501 domain-containing protein [Alphaproteobacteria bacterium]
MRAPSRRDVLRGAAALGLGGWMGWAPRAQALQASRRRFVFFFARGGWDTTRVFSPMLSAPAVDTEPIAVRVVRGDLEWVDHPDRPSVGDFFRTYGERAAVVDGMLVRSVNHAVCERLVLTGEARLGAPDWPSVLGSVVGSEHALPNLVLGGPSVPGALHRYTSIIGRSDQLQDLLDGQVFQRGDLDVRSLTTRTEGRVDALVRARVEAAFAGSDASTTRGQMLDAYLDGLDRMDRLRDDAQLVRFDGEGSSQIQTVVDLLRHGVARCVCFAKTGFDTHARIDEHGPLIEDLFGGINDLMALLDATPGETEARLSDETVVVVLSEMGRTPYRNTSDGKDHWPYTAAMVIGPGVRGGRRIGGYDGYLNGQAVDLASGELAPSGTVITPKHLGATILALADLDPTAWVGDTPTIDAILA